MKHTSFRTISIATLNSSKCSEQMMPFDLIKLFELFFCVLFSGIKNINIPFQ